MTSLSAILLMTGNNSKQQTKNNSLSSHLYSSLLSHRNPGFCSSFFDKSPQILCQESLSKYVHKSLNVSEKHSVLECYMDFQWEKDIYEVVHNFIGITWFYSAYTLLGSVWAHSLNATDRKYDTIQEELENCSMLGRMNPWEVGNYS